MTARRPRTIRVCMFPKRVEINESIGMMSDALERTGEVEIVPYGYLRSLFQPADLFHAHWPDHAVYSPKWPKYLLKIPLFLAYVMLSRALGRPVVWTVHNIGAHESDHPVAERFLWRNFLSRVDWTIHLCPATTEAIRKLTSTPPKGSVIPRPHYRSVYDHIVAEQERGATADNDGNRPFVVSSFGLIRAYKGMENLIEVFRTWNHPNSMLRIGGSPLVPKVGEELRKTASGDSRIRLDLRALEHAELAELVRNSNVIVLPYRKIMNSGVAAAALSLGCPILAPAAGCILDYRDRLGEDWVMTFDGDLAPEHLQRAFERFAQRDRRATPDLTFMDPDVIGREILSVYRRLLDGRTKSSEAE